MSVRRQLLRRIGGALARVGAVGSAGMLVLTIVGLTIVRVDSAGAATIAGAAQVVTPLDGTSTAGQPLLSGGSATAFSLLLPTGAACLGDSANDGYRVQSYMVRSTIDPTTLTFNSSGPVPGGLAADFSQPLFDATTTSGYVDAQTANATTVGGPGPVVNIPGFSFAVFAPGDLPAGTYNVGIACTKGPASTTQVEKLWNTTMTVVESAADQPAGVTWTAPEEDLTSVTTTSTTSTTSSTTSTTAGDGSTTTTDGSTTTTDDPTTTTAAAVVASGGVPTGTSVVGSLTQLPVTGGSTTSLVVWAVLLLVFGRMAVLLSRPPRVKAVAA